MKRTMTMLILLSTTAGLAGCIGVSGGTQVSPSVAAKLAASGGVSSSSGSSDETVSYPKAVTSNDTYQTNAVHDASFAELINGVRASNGAGSVSYNAKLDQAAQGHADDMLANDYFSHTSIDGRTLSDRVNASGYKWKKVGENIGQGQTSEQEVLDGWVASPHHQANNIDPDFEEFGLGRAGTGLDTRWVLVFGDPSE